jgi:hypothetical protein
VRNLGFRPPLSRRPQISSVGHCRKNARIVSSPSPSLSERFKVLRRVFTSFLAVAGHHEPSSSAGHWRLSVLRATTGAACRCVRLDTCTDSSCWVFVTGGPFGSRTGCHRTKIPFGGTVPKLAVCCGAQGHGGVWLALLFIILRKQRSGVWRGRPQTSAEGTGHGGGPGSGYKSRPEQEWPSVVLQARDKRRNQVRAGWPASMAINIPQMPFLSFGQKRKKMKIFKKIKR